MSGQEQVRQRTSLRITAGAGDGQEVSAEVAAQYSGRIGDVLGRIVREQIHDAELLSMIEDERVILELSGGGGEGGGEEPVEMPVSPNDDWARVVDGLRQGDRTLGIDRKNSGGAA